MNVLLDTHVLIWSVGEPGRLGRKCREILEDEATRVWLSPISIWECLLLGERGRVSLEPSPLSWVRGVLSSRLFQEAPLNHEVAIRSREVDLPHRDPADRFLAATAAVFDLTLLTSDVRLLQGEGYRAMAVV